MLPRLEDLTLLSTEEVEVILRAHLDPSWTFSIHLVRPINVWACVVYDDEKRVQWYHEHADRRLLLFDLYGWLLQRRGYEAAHPVWQRRGEVQIPARYGRLAYQGDIQLPDAPDLDPDEVAAVYGVPARKGNK